MRESGFRDPSLFWHCSAIGKHLLKKGQETTPAPNPKLTYEKNLKLN